jgi:hypothetical protein
MRKAKKINILRYKASFHFHDVCVFNQASYDTS